jgi:hypothetical protein
VSGHVAKPGNYEIRLGTPFSELLQMAGGMRAGRTLKAVIPGGSSMKVLPAEAMMACTMDYDSIQKAGSGLGSGAVIVMDDTACMVRACQRIARFYFKESCGQCTPCREGTGWMYRMLTRIVEGKATLDDLQMLRAAAGQIEGHTICAFGEAAAWPVQGFLHHFWNEFEYAIVNGRFLVDDQRAGTVVQPAGGRRMSAVGIDQADTKPVVPEGHVAIEIDGVAMTAPKGSMIIQAADKAGIPIPRFCYHDKLSIAANCRMCLVEVEKMPKPAPACATPVMDGMKVVTRSDKALKSQRNVMEFLLINHPLDCPICDQGGECELQDLSLGYGRSVSRFSERKRVVADEDFGPLVASDMTRCIQCTRCVRFTAEVAGTYELGGMMRGENLQIGTYDGKPLTTELSGNVIDVCPVGALTNKVFRFKARPWELVARESLGFHDALGSNLFLHVRRGEVLRTVPRDNEAVNECWLSDRDRYSHQGLYAAIARRSRWCATATTGAKPAGKKRWPRPRRSCATAAATSSACSCTRPRRTRRAPCSRASPRPGHRQPRPPHRAARPVRRRRCRSLRHGRRRHRKSRRDRHRRLAPAPRSPAAAPAPAQGREERRARPPGQSGRFRRRLRCRVEDDRAAVAAGDRAGPRRPRRRAARRW